MAYVRHPTWPVDGRPLESTSQLATFYKLGHYPTRIGPKGSVRYLGDMRRRYIFTHEYRTFQYSSSRSPTLHIAGPEVHESSLAIL